MFGSYFDNPRALALLGAMFVLAAVSFVGERIRRRRLRLWAATSFAFRPGGLRFLSLVLLLLGLGLLIVGIAGPKWGIGEIPELAGGRDLVCVLDASRSMLAEDVLPSRFQRAKDALAELSRSIQKRGGHRLGLVVFAGRAQIVCPLTRDYDHFRTALAQIDAAELPAELRASGGNAPSGTRIGAGLMAAVEAHNAENRGFQDILLISDGDDPALDGEWHKGVQAARSAGIPIHVVGVGDPAKGHPIPGRNGSPFRHDREVVLTRLEEQLLEEIAEGTGGSYVPGRTGEIALGPWFNKRIASNRLNILDEDPLAVKGQRYPWFLGLALLVLGLDIVLVRALVKKR
jgi:Ca-activated chloride channel family protein